LVDFYGRLLPIIVFLVVPLIFVVVDLDLIPEDEEYELNPEELAMAYLS
jgi:hypothetical protein